MQKSDSVLRATEYEIKPQIIKMAAANPFRGDDTDNPYKHIKWFTMQQGTTRRSSSSDPVQKGDRPQSDSDLRPRSCCQATSTAQSWLDPATPPTARRAHSPTSSLAAPIECAPGEGRWWRKRGRRPNRGPPNPAAPPRSLPHCFFFLREAPQIQLSCFSGAPLVNAGDASSLLEGFRM